MTMPESPKSSAMVSLVKIMIGICLGLVTATASPSDEPELKFSVRVAPTIQRAFQEIWEKTPRGRGPKVAVADKAYPGQELYVHVMSHGLAVGPAGKAQADYSISVYKPDGTISYTQSDLTLVSIAANADRRMVHKAPGVTTIVLNSDDPAGKWLIVVEAIDRVSNSTARSETSVMFEKPYRPEPLSPEAGQWLMAYHFSPKPQQLPAYLKYMAANPPMKDGKPRPLETMGPLLGFFEQVMADNPWLLSHLIDDFAQASPAEKAQLAGLLAYAKRDDAKFASRLPAELKKAVQQYRGTRWPVPSAEPLDGAQLDVLWGRFFASGAYQPLRDLVGVLAYHPYRNAIEEYRQLEKKPKVVPVEVYKNAVFRSAVWSLGSNIQQDTLVRDYCEGMLLREELPRDLQMWLLGALRAALEKHDPVKGPLAEGESGKGKS